MIAETTALPTKFAKVVVTDEQGRFVCGPAEGLVSGVGPGIWVGGFAAGGGDAGEGRDAAGHDGADAAGGGEIPSNYWYSLIKVPPRSEFPGTGPPGTGLRSDSRRRSGWIT